MKPASKHGLHIFFFEMDCFDFSNYDHNVINHQQKIKNHNNLIKCSKPAYSV